jgi:hypothetical protein
MPFNICWNEPLFNYMINLALYIIYPVHYELKVSIFDNCNRMFRIVKKHVPEIEPEGE